MCFAIVLAILLVAGIPGTQGQLSKTVEGVHDRSTGGVANRANTAKAQARLRNKAHEDATANKDVRVDEIEVDESECPQDLELRWMSEAQSSVYATPLITDLFSDGHKDIVVPSFVHHLEVLEAEDGSSAPGWPAFHKSLVHASPITYDIDFDGVQDILLTTYDGEILAFRDNGDLMAEKLIVPRLRMRRNWYKGLAADPVDHSNPDIGDTDSKTTQSGTREALIKGTQRRLLSADHTVAPGNRRRQLLVDANSTATETTLAPEQKIAAEAALQKLLAAEGGSSGSTSGPISPIEGAVNQAAKDGSVFAEEAGQLAGQLASHNQNAKSSEDADRGTDQNVRNQAKNELSNEAYDSFQELFGEDAIQNDPNATGGEGYDTDYEGALQHGEEGTADFDGEGIAPGGDYNNEDYEEVSRHRAAELKAEHDLDMNHLNRTGEGLRGANITDTNMLKGGWEDEEFDQVNVEQPEPEFVYIDSHLLCNPVIGDLDGDGHDELVVAVSYFFDRQYYEDTAHSMMLPKGLDLSKYVASGVVVFDLRTRSIKWSTHLDMSTDSTLFRAYAYSAPTLADLDGDGKLNVILGTSVGFLYVLDHRGVAKEGWPKQMGEIQGQPACADINGDGKLEVVAADTKGNIAAFWPSGEEVWERHLGSLIAQGPTLGDIDGDGEIDVVFGTASGKIYALHGKTGLDKPNFPFYTQGRIMAPVLITKLKGEEARSLHLVVVSFDGYLYMVDGATGCADVQDIGETSYSMVLADDLNDDGRTDLVVTTMNGNVYAFQTGAKHHPLASWTSQVHGRSTQMARVNTRGVYATKSSRAARDVRGKTLPVRFEIVDSRVTPVDPEAAREGRAAEAPPVGAIPAGPYTVSVSLRGVGLDAMNSGAQPVIGLTEVFNRPGIYTIDIPCPRSQSMATIRIEMTDESKSVFVDEYSLAFHMHYYRLLKWILAAPFTAAAIAVLAMKLGPFNDQLPTLHRNTAS